MPDKGDRDGDLSEVELLKIARDEAHRTIDHQIDTLDDIDDKAAKLLRLNLILIGILLSAFSIVANENGLGNTIGSIESTLNLYLFTGVFAIIASTALAAFTYTASSKRGGMSGRDIAKMIDNDHSPEQNLKGMVESYSIWMQYNFKVNTKNAPLGTSILVLLFYGLVLIAVGVYHGLVSETGIFTLTTVVLVLALFTWKSGIYSQTRRYMRYRDFNPAED